MEWKSYDIERFPFISITKFIPFWFKSIHKKSKLIAPFVGFL